MKLLIVEDTIELLDLIAIHLSKENIKCEKANNYSSAQEKIALYLYDVAIIDINLPGGSGLNLIKTLKNVSLETGIIIISAKSQIVTKVDALELGADDYLTKPFDMTELTARVKALFRRRKLQGTPIVSIGQIEVNTAMREVTVNKKIIELTKSEYDILLFFMSNRSKVLGRDTIAEHIWGDNMDLADSYDFIYSHIKNLRKKITTAGTTDPIKAVYGIGYKFDTDESDE